jgi:glutathione S-transferase
MAMKIYGHPWSTNTRNALATLAEKGHEAELVLVMIPKGEQKQPAHLALHPWGKVPVLDDDGFILYETRAIHRYLDRKLAGPKLTPDDPRQAARGDQWIQVADAYFVPHAHGIIFETLFRPFLGGAKNEQAIADGREGIQLPLDTLDRWLSSNAFLGGDAFSLADIHWMPYFEYLSKIGEGEPIVRRHHVDAWWRRVSARPAWHKVARTGPQPYDPAVAASVIESLRR